MLKALELVGFKSFADRTRFEFPEGITVVVGPNGSGKSNIVDAIKWVLGEQSVKSLRGKEMADVIFNGSGTRRATNTAEITVTFDNSGGFLEVDAPEVHITRRVYRSGEGEYLINRQPARLRDIRDLLRGTGMGTQAYSVIEQGKVDVLLQSSPRDRRMIFEEAAGISRFKSKKIEALRRLERVEQNLLRLSDIVDEVDNRLRSVRLQAGKARRYRQYADRLQELRTQVGLVDWRRLGDRLAETESRRLALGAARDAAVAQAEAIEADLLETETRIGDVTESIRESETRIADNRARIAAAESTVEHERHRSRDLEREVARYREQVAAMSLRAGDLEQQLAETLRAVEDAEEHHREIARRFAEGERGLTGLIERLDRARAEHDQQRAAHIEKMRLLATLGNQISGLETEVAAADASRGRCRQRLAELDEQSTALAAEWNQLAAEGERLSQCVDEQTAQWSAAKAALVECDQRLGRRRNELGELRQRRSGLRERIAVLEELERRHEGLSPGVQEVLIRSRDEAGGPFRQVRGLVADLLHVGIEAAPLIEVALGDRAQHVVVEPGGELIEFLREETHALAGRVGFVWLDGSADAPSQQPASLDGRPGVLGRADRFVETEPPYRALAKRLLGKTWIVEKLRHALALRVASGEGASFVTVAGELLVADGTLIVGPKNTSTGLISRRSELRALRGQLADWEGRIEQVQEAVRHLERQIAEAESLVARLGDERQAAIDALTEHGRRAAAAQERDQQLKRQRAVFEGELRAACVQHDSAERALSAARSQRERMELELADVEARLARLSEDRERLETERDTRERDTTEAKVELAKSEERLRNLQARRHQFEESRQERRRVIAENREHLLQCVERAEQSQRSILAAESEIAELYLRKESFARHTVELVEQREELRRERARATAEAQQVRARLRKLEEQIHAEELAGNEVRHDRNSLADRLREDYGIELAELEHEPSDEEQHQRESVQEEIDDLRRRISNLGNVNLEALEELQQLESRHALLAGQYKDLVDAKTSLERIIDKINVDSRLLFTETLETVKGHFATLFRNLFGGGQADIVLEDDVDILESGIEIVARPPGKEPRSISLLSGGEKTLTCVALLLAIFRSRPSPFCVLDEVDAALDEANIDRFTKVLEGFLAWTQFIIVTHSKKTMTCANTIYGVTMQESGVSKPVSVRFEDVSDDGEIVIAPEATGEPASGAQDDETQAA